MASLRAPAPHPQRSSLRSRLKEERSAMAWLSRRKPAYAESKSPREVALPR
jgi:hypothetical protein